MLTVQLVLHGVTDLVVRSILVKGVSLDQVRLRNLFMFSLDFISTSWVV